MLKITYLGNPATKKNSQRIIWTGGYARIIQSKRFLDYEKDCILQTKKQDKLKIDYPINLKCVYFRATKHRVDLTNLLSATNDILVNAEVLKDDNFKIVQSVDGSEVLFDKHNPRVEITITKK